MKPRSKGVTRAQRSQSFQSEGPNWVLIAGGAILSTLSIRLGYKLKQLNDTKQQESSSKGSKGHGRSANAKNLGSCHFHSNAYTYNRDENSCCNCHSAGSAIMGDMKQQCDDSGVTEPEITLPLVKVPVPEFSKENSVIWSASPDRLELPQKPFHKSNSSDSPCVSEAGSDLFSNREVIQKLRQQLKRRDEMIMEMQDQIAELQNSLATQLGHSTHLQSLLDAANRDLFDSEREIQRLRKAIADYCVGQEVSVEKCPSQHIWPEGRNGHANGYPEVDHNVELSEKERDGERIEMLKREVNELKEVIEGKEFLMQSYKEQKTELSAKIKELQQRLDSQLPNIL